MPMAPVVSRCALALTLLAASAVPSSAQGPPPAPDAAAPARAPTPGPKRILNLYATVQAQPLHVAVSGAFEETLTRTVPNAEHYHEYLDLARFDASEEYWLALRDFFQRKY